jgi:hypothetical protein
MDSKSKQKNQTKKEKEERDPTRVSASGLWKNCHLQLRGLFEQVSFRLEY